MVGETLRGWSFIERARVLNVGLDKTARMLCLSCLHGVVYALLAMAKAGIRAITALDLTDLPDADERRGPK